MFNHVVATAFAQTAGDLACCFIAIACLIKNKHHNKVFFYLNSFAFFMMAIGDFQYNYLFRIKHFDIKYSNDIIGTLTMLCFQLSQTYNWRSLIIQQKAVIFSRDNLPSLLFSIMVIFVLIYYFVTGDLSTYTTGIWYRSLNFFYQSINVSINMLVWTFAIICLARSRSLSITLMALGCLMIVSAALTFDCLFMINMNKIVSASSIHLIWALGVLTMASGLALCLRKHDFTFCPNNSIQARCCSLLGITCVIIVLIVFSLLSIFNFELSVDIGSLLWSVPIVLVFSMTTSVLLGNWFAVMILLPIRHFLKLIEIFNSGQQITDDGRYATNLYEFTVLGDFINKSFINLSTQLDREIKMAAQVAHDIRSPLTALEVVIKRLPEIEESKRILLRDATNHIRDITNNLEKKSIADNKHEQVSIIQTAVLLDYVISERRAAFSNQPIEIIHDLDPACYNLFIQVIPSEMRRVLTNIINNACEAISTNNGTVSVDITREGNGVVITVCDNGPGLANDITSSLFTRGFTTKATGSGLGLFHAKESLAKWNGTIELITAYNQGCKAKIMLPIQKPPYWFVSTLTLLDNTSLICVDDSISIWHAWQERFKTITGDIDLRYCNSKEEFMLEINQNNMSQATFLIDYEYSGKRYTGLDLINILLESKSTANNRIFLVTSRSNEHAIQEFCNQKGIYLIPKFFALKIPLQIINRSCNKRVLSSLDKYCVLTGKALFNGSKNEQLDVID